jgi:DNA-binding response OmpR family regulator
MDGRELARRAREQRPEILLIVASARHRLSADETPGGVFLPKPYSPYQLVDLVRSELDRRVGLRDGGAVEAHPAGEGPISLSAGLGLESAHASAGYLGGSVMDGARPAVVG